MKIIAFTGVKGSGKSTASEFLKDLHPGLKEITLAKRLKDASSIALGVDRDSFDNPAIKEKEFETPIQLDEKNVAKIFEVFKVTPDYDAHIRPHIGKMLFSPRRVAQYVGTEILRSYNPDIHCEGAVLDIEADGVYVVTDMRFMGEYEFFSKRFSDSFYPYYISNMLAERKVDNHPSELQVFEVAKHCTKVTNNGTLEDFRGTMNALSAHVISESNSRKGTSNG